MFDIETEPEVDEVEIGVAEVDVEEVDRADSMFSLLQKDRRKSDHEMIDLEGECIT